MFRNSLARNKWEALSEAIDAAPTVVPCTNTDPDLWFPDDSDRGQSDTRSRYRVAKKLCAECPVQQLCLEYAIIQQEEYGMWGGLTPVERLRLRGRKR